MFVCRLFHRSNPFEQVEARLFADGRLSIGRDPSADWQVDDKGGALSRVHFTLAFDQGTLTLIDSSTNGTFLSSGQRAPRDVPVPITVRETLHFGALSLLVDRPDERVSDDTALLTAGKVAPLPGDWLDGPAPSRPPHLDDSLIEAFCEGARLDSSALSGEDPAVLMRRVGAIYQQTILGLATLVAERARMKGDHSLDHTTISAADNNPFKWAPTRKLALTLLCKAQPGFLGEVDAVRASFEDVAHHLSAMVAGADAALHLVLDGLNPQTIETEADEQGFSLRGRAAIARDIHARRHAAFAGGDPALIDRAFADGYARSTVTPAERP